MFVQMRLAKAIDYQGWTAVCCALRQRWCGVRFGHDMLLQFEKARILATCANCGYQSPGISWTLAPSPPQAGKVLRFVKRIRRAP